MNFVWSLFCAFLDHYYQLLYEEVDERNVAVTRLFHGEFGGGWENQRYPIAGK